MITNLKFTSEQWVIMLPIVLMALDIITGYLNAWNSHNIQSSKMRSGIVKKAGEVIALLALLMITFAMQIPYDVVKFFSILLIFTEANSIIENLDKMGVPIPSFVKVRINNEIEEMNKGIKG